MPEGTVLTPALDELAAKARSYLAEHWDQIVADGVADSHDRRVRAAEAAAMSACRIGPPESATGAATPDQLARAARVLAAHVEMQRLANELGPTGAVAANVLVALDMQVGSLQLGADAASASTLARLCVMVAHFPAQRPDGLIDDICDLVRGAADLERQEW